MENRKTIRKWFWVWDFEKEEDWLNEMAMNGWVLESVGFCTYHFLRCEPGEYSVRLEMHPYDESYISFMKDTGAEYVGRMVMWIYFRKKTADGPFDLFSDNEKFDRLINCVENPNNTIAADESLGEGFCIGHSYFCNLKDLSDKTLSRIVEFELIPLLKEYWFDEPVKVKDWINNLRSAIK